MSFKPLTVAIPAKQIYCLHSFTYPFEADDDGTENNNSCWFVKYRNDCVLKEFRQQTGTITPESQITCFTELFSSTGLLIVHLYPNC